LGLIKKTAAYFILLLPVLIAQFSCQRGDEFPADKMYICGAEELNPKGDKFLADNDSSFYFGGGKLQSDKDAYAGNYSAITTPKKAYAFTYQIKNAGPDWYFKLSVWRKSKDGKGVLVAGAKQAKVLYEATSTPVETINGWEKLELEVYTPPTFFNDELKFYVWNNGTDTVLFDNFKIERFAYKRYPGFNETPLAIVFDSSDYLKILNKRIEAFNMGVLQTADDDWVKAIVFGNNEMMKAKIRLKGDWLDHLKGEKWSFRVKLRKNYTWNHLRTFSLQTPLARGFLNEWISHKFYDVEDILTTRYGFIPLIINHNSKGIYAWEEHFEKQLLESRNRREGPILKFSEDAFWQIQKYSIQIDESWPLMPYYEAAVIKPFKPSKTMETPTLYHQFLNAQKLAHQYKNRLMPPGTIFDLDKLAKYYAMLELTRARHGMVWHNQRMYFNPVLCKLEPIAFDGFSNTNKLVLGIRNNYAYLALKGKDTIQMHQSLIYNLFLDSSFTNRYINYLILFSDSTYVKEMLDHLMPEIRYNDSLLRREFPYYEHDYQYYFEVASDIRSYLAELENMIRVVQSDPDYKMNIKPPYYTDSTVFEDTPKFFVHAYLEETIDDSVVIDIHNYFPGDIIILGTGRKQKYISSFQHPEPKIKAYRGDGLKSTTIVSDTGSVYLFFMLPGGIESFATEILPWPYPQGYTPQQELVQGSKLEDYTGLIIKQGNRLIIPAGDHKVDRPVIIPEGYTLYFEPGARVDFTNSSMFISYAPIEMIGTDENKIIITSSDFSANGFTILQANDRSRIDHVVFENLNTLDYKGWTLTGAVTFYESDVDISNTTFYRNQCEDALNTIRSDFKLDKSTFSHIYGDAFDSDFCTGLVINCAFKNIGNDAIDFSGSQIKIADTEIIAASDKGISGGEDSYLTVENTIIINSNIGLASKDLSIIDVKNSLVQDCNYGIVLLQKKPEYGAARMILSNTQLLNTKTKLLIEQGSRVVVDGEEIIGEKKDVASIFYD